MSKHKDKATARTAPTLQDQLPELRPGQSVALLQELHILTREGKLNQDTRRKLKQVYHLVQFIEPLLAEVLAARGDVALADHGAGKSYLGFILYDLFFKDKAAGRVTGVETRAELVDKSRELATRLGFERMDFLATTVQEALTHPDLPARIDVVTALHACDTATDDAIAFGLAKDASHLVLVPCCQAEVAGVMKKHKALSLARTPLAELWRHPLHTREFGSQITNVLRCLQLEAHGYSVTVTELVGWEHSLKNELILARRMTQDRTGARDRARQRLQQVLEELSLQELSQRFAV
ncbi:class I SAM-dependent methyltransferase [Hydrogenophaga sp.]|uniref:class I SAM-dependent methyltransferase n=1 Tax=Hydrogenophaga sp. TaxID=1904254 RepID=UPI003F6FFAC6